MTRRMVWRRTCEGRALELVRVLGPWRREAVKPEPVRVRTSAESKAMMDMMLAVRHNDMPWISYEPHYDEAAIRAFFGPKRLPFALQHNQPLTDGPVKVQDGVGRVSE